MKRANGITEQGGLFFNAPKFRISTVNTVSAYEWDQMEPRDIGFTRVC